MLKSKKMLQINVALILVLVIALAVVLPLSASTAKAETVAEVESDAPETRGILTKLTLTLTNDYEGYVTATARNDFTLGYSIIQVVVEIYSSYEFKESYLLMNREARIATSDLDIYQELTVTCPTGGEIKYWCAVMKFKQDQKDWTTKCTPMVLLDGNGNKIS